jgi:hypothetical protein
MSSGKRAQEGSEGRGGPYLLTSQHGLCAAGAQDPCVIDAVASDKSGVDEGEGLHPDMTAARGFSQIDGLVEESLESQLLGQRGRQNKARVSNGSGIREGY